MALEWVLLFFSFFLFLFSLFLEVPLRRWILLYTFTLFFTALLYVMGHTVFVDDPNVRLIWYHPLFLLPFSWFLVATGAAGFRGRILFWVRIFPVGVFLLGGVLMGVAPLWVWDPESFSPRWFSYVSGGIMILYSLAVVFFRYERYGWFFRAYSPLLAAAPLGFPFIMLPEVFILWYLLGLSFGCMVFLSALAHDARVDVLPAARELIFDAMPDPVIVLDATDRIRFINKACERLVGHASQEVRGKEIDVLFPGGLFPLSLRAHMERFEIQVGSTLFEVHATWITDALGRRKGTLFHLSDITAEREAVNTLALRERQYRNVLENITVGVMLINREYVVRAWNRRMEEWFPGIPWGKEGVRCVEICKGPVLPCEECPLPPVFASGKTQRREVRRHTEEGERIFSMVATPHLDDEGVIRGVVVLLEDVTAERRATEGLERYKFMVNASADFMSLISSDFRYEAVNDAFCKAHGRGREDFVGRRVADLWGEETFRGKILPYIRRAFEGERVVVEDRFVFGLLGERDLEVSYNPYREGDRITHVAVVTRDITSYKDALRRLEDARRQAEEASRAKSAFLASMSHEIRTPLNAITGMSDLLLLSRVSPEVEEGLAIIKDSAGTLLALINDILDLSRIEAGRIELERIPLRFPDLVRHTWEMFRPQAETKGLSFELRLSEGLPPVVNGDPVRIRQILINLLSNALKFTEEGGVTLSVTGHRMYDRDWEVELVVEDTGIGIPPEKLERIFEPFTQADSSITRRYGGTGLGLSISRQLAEMMGGTIVVSSEVGRGSTFVCRIVLEEAEGEAAPPAKGQVSRASRAMRVLVVEDNRVNALVARRLLEHLGHRVLVAGSGREALDLLGREEVDAVFMDVEMPGMDGFECARRIRAGEAGERARVVPVFALTAHAVGEIRDRVDEVGMNGVVLKPVGIEDLDRALGRVAGRGEEVFPPVQDLSEEDLPHLDVEGSLLRMGGSRELLREFWEVFLRDLAEKRSSLSAALEGEEWVALSRLAHSLKGVCGNVGGVRAASLARRLEGAASRGAVEEARRLARELDEELGILGELLGRGPDMILSEQEDGRSHG
ncbi:PAS domain-containing protein [Spirochaeta thermophila]|uniref:Sensory/regulatory protein RpfC n=1 Tax=Winmispira thermophila (strain ATCC 49972 / DSM 6192 / RI 19.B1) TaxID=665571 RepID=E0RNK0_WINT6|nr:PAS domain-containing protein [Spirochaeta thermophila]ADN02591.1 autoinducer 2 sensor kinase/phosphatase LuxQ [Spirochaeta thermophila DSM 6192]